MKRRRLSLHVVSFFKAVPLLKITSFDIERYKKHRLLQVAICGDVKQKPKDTNKLKITKPGTINRELAAISHLFNKAVEWGWIDRGPAVIKRCREEQSRITPLTVEQIKRLIECAKQDQNPQIYPAGMDPDEVVRHTLRHHTLGSGWSGPAYGKKDFRAQNPNNG